MTPGKARWGYSFSPNPQKLLHQPHLPAESTSPVGLLAPTNPALGGWGQVSEGAYEFARQDNRSLQAHPLGPSALGGVWRGWPAPCGQPVVNIPCGKAKTWSCSGGTWGKPRDYFTAKNPGSRGEVNAPGHLTANARLHQLAILFTAFAS